MLRNPHNRQSRPRSVFVQRSNYPSANVGIDCYSFVVHTHPGGQTMIEIAFASLTVLALVNLFAISTTRIQSQSLVWRRRNAGLTLGSGVPVNSTAWLRPHPQSQHVPTPFRERLAHYLRCDESRLFGSRSPSTMVFWATSIYFTGKPAKSRRYIRSLLTRIQRRLRDD